jgi:uncharacterized membrane protein
MHLKMKSVYGMKIGETYVDWGQTCILLTRSVSLVAHTILWFVHPKKNITKRPHFCVNLVNLSQLWTKYKG